MIDKQHGKFIVVCDDCGEEYEPDATEFADIVEEIKNQEWTIRKRGQKWEHYCEQCSQEEVS